MKKRIHSWFANKTARNSQQSAPNLGQVLLAQSDVLPTLESEAKAKENNSWATLFTMS